MKIMTNITNTTDDLERYSGGDDIRRFCREQHLDGLELMPVGQNTLGIIPADTVKGVHLSFYSCWVDFWNHNEVGILAEFGTWDTAKEVLGASRKMMVNRYRAQLDFAQSLNAEYVVYHVSDVSIAESVSYMFRHKNREVIDAALELINMILDGGHYSFKFLVENLWWPGFTMTFPDMTRYLLNGIDYQNKGIMLDIGHLLHTNIALASEEDGLKYINTMLDAHIALCDRIKGVHLHQSLSGTYVRSLIGNPPKLEGSYSDRLGRIYEHIYAIDAHRPFLSKGIGQLIKRINPEYLTYEFMTQNRTEHETNIRKQNAALMLEFMK